jgi:cytidylate kinase
MLAYTYNVDSVLREKSFQKMARYYLLIRMCHFITIAIDGAAAAGKTSTAIHIARKYNMLMASTGLYYRALTLAMITFAVENDDPMAVGDFLQSVNLGSSISGHTANISINGRTFDDSELRTQSVNEAVAIYSSIPMVREFLTDYQRSQVGIAGERGFNGLVMEGRDITTVILPDADLRFFLDASTEERSRRREHDSTSDCVAARDRIDNQRTICSSGVFRIDTNRNDLNAVVEIISSEIDKILAR